MSPACLAALLSLTVAAPLPPRPVYLWKFETGRTFYLETSADTQQEMVISGQKVTQKQAQVFTFSLTPERQLADGTWLVRQRIVGVRMTIDMGGNRIEYDSAGPKRADGPLAGVFDSLVGAEFTLRLDRARGVVAVEGREELVRRMSDVRPEMKPLLQTILTDDTLKEMNGQTFTALPERRVLRGDSWTRHSRLDLGPIGSYDTTHRYTYLEPNGPLERFRVEVTELRYQPPGTATPGVLPFKVVKADLRGSGRSGEMHFDRERGRVVRFESGLTLEGNLTIEIGGQETSVDLKQEQKATVRTLDANPLAR